MTGHRSSRAIALGGWALTVGLSVAASTFGAAYGRPPELYLPATVSGIVYATAGAVIYMRQPGNLTGVMLFATAALPAALAVLRYLVPAAVALNLAFGMSVALVPLAYVVLTFPFGRFTARADRLMFYGVVALAIAGGLAELAAVEPKQILAAAFCTPCPPSPFRVLDASLYPTVSLVTNSSLLVVAVIIIARLVVRWRKSAGLTRSALTPVVLGGSALGAGYAVTIFVTPLIGVAPAVVALILLGFRLLVPIGLAVVFVRFNVARGVVVRELLRLGPRARLAAIQLALQRSLGDPSLAVLTPSATGSYVDLAGGAVDIAAVAGTRGVLEVGGAGRQVAVVLHDPALAADQELLTVIGDTVRYAAESSEIHDELVARGGDVARLPHGAITFLFGDVERSTELLQRLGDGYAATIDRLREVVRGEAESNHGHVVDMRADECFVAFAAAADALTAAAGIQRSLSAAASPEGSDLRLRIGLHSGTPELTRSGYVGLDVHHAARVMATALGGQVVASQAFVDALRKEGRTAAISTLGSFALRGIPGEETLYEVGPA